MNTSTAGIVVSDTGVKYVMQQSGTRFACYISHSRLMRDREGIDRAMRKIGSHWMTTMRRALSFSKQRNVTIGAKKCENTGRKSFRDVIDRRNTQSLKWGRYGDDTIPMWVADMDFPAADPIVDVVVKRAQSGIYGYARPSERLKELTRERMIDMYGANPNSASENWIHWLPGLVPGIRGAVRATVRRGESVLTLTPAYPPFLFCPHISGRKLKSVDLSMTKKKGENGIMEYSLDLEAIETSLSDSSVRMFLLCSPHNPTGRVWTIDELREMAILCVKHDVVICSDEVWGDMCLEPDGAPFVSLLGLCDEIAGLAERLIVVTSPSKMFNVAGLDMAYAVVPDERLRHRYVRASRDKAETTHFGYDACEVAYGDDDAEAWRQDVLSYLRENRDYATKYVASEIPLATCTVPEASYLLWIDARAFLARDIESSSPAAWIESNFKVALSEGSDFGGHGFVRLNYGCHRSTLEEGLRRLRDAFRAIDPAGNRGE